MSGLEGAAQQAAQQATICGGVLTQVDNFLLFKLFPFNYCHLGSTLGSHCFFISFPNSDILNSKWQILILLLSFAKYFT